MAVLTAARRQREQAGSVRLGFRMGTDIVYQGGLVSVLNTAGLAIAGADTANHILLGVAAETVDNSAGATGTSAPDINVWTEGVFEFVYDTPVQTLIGKLVYALDDQTVGLAAAATNNILVGQVVAINADAGTVRVKLLHATA